MNESDICSFVHKGQAIKELHALDSTSIDF